MSSKNTEVFTKEKLDLYFKALASEYKKAGGRKYPLEIVLIGGASIVVNYQFRNMTTDIDAILPSISILKDVINKVGDMYNLPNGWLNSDFKKTQSYSAKLYQFSVFYKTFSQILTIRTVTDEYLIAMKLMSGRKYKNDLSDIVGILSENKAKGEPIRLDQIENAINNLYGSKNKLPSHSLDFLQDLFKENNYDKLLKYIKENESATKSALIEFEKEYPSLLTEELANDISNKEQLIQLLQQRLTKS